MKMGSGTKGLEHFAEQALIDGRLIDARRNEEAADEAFEIFEDVIAVTRGLGVDDCHVAAKRARIDKFADEFDRRTVIPEKFFLPAASLFLEKRVESLRVNLPEIQNLH